MNIGILQLRVGDESEEFMKFFGKVTMDEATPALADVQRHYAPAWFGKLVLGDLVEEAGFNPRDIPRGDDKDWIEFYLRAIWQVVEIGGPDCSIPRTADKIDSIRSFMVGDVILIENHPYIVRTVGFEALHWGATDA